jgi:hypothetical protein
VEEGLRAAAGTAAARSSTGQAHAHHVLRGPVRSFTPPRPTRPPTPYWRHAGPASTSRRPSLRRR